MSGDDDQGSGAAGGAVSATEQLIEMFVDLRQKGRPVFRELHGVAHGRLEMDPNRLTDLRVGVFARDALPTWVRFSSDAGPQRTGPALNPRARGEGVRGPWRERPGRTRRRRGLYIPEIIMSLSGRRPGDVP